MLGVAILIIVMSVMNGFKNELTKKILGLNPHVVVQSNSFKIDEKFIMEPCFLVRINCLHTEYNEVRFIFI